MKMCLNVGIGCGKAECEDTAVFNNTLVNDKTILLDSDIFQCVGVADGKRSTTGTSLFFSSCATIDVARKT